MSLINCPECNTPVSEKATQCPQCAYPIAAAIPAQQNEVVNNLFPGSSTGISGGNIQMSSGGPSQTEYAPVPLPGLKNMALAVVLPVLFGPLGLFYASTKRALYTIGALILISIMNADTRASNPTAYAARIVLLGFGSWLGSIIASVVIVDKHNKKIRQQYLSALK